MGLLKKDLNIKEMELEDVDAVLSIDKKIRKTGEAVTYEHTTTESILTIDKIGHGQEAMDYADMITGDIAGILKTSFVAKVNDKTVGFVISRKASIGDPPTEIGLILIMGVLPKHWREGIATKLIEALINKFQSMGIKEIRIPLDERDEQLRNFFKKMGFGVGHMIDYSKKL